MKVNEVMEMRRCTRKQEVNERKLSDTNESIGTYVNKIIYLFRGA